MNFILVRGMRFELTINEMVPFRGAQKIVVKIAFLNLMLPDRILSYHKNIYLNQRINY